MKSSTETTPTHRRAVRSATAAILTLAAALLACGGAPPAQYPGRDAFEACRDEVRAACERREGIDPNEKGGAVDSILADCTTPSSAQEGETYRGLPTAQARAKWLAKIGCAEAKYAGKLDS